jgi:hypothetical protein
MGRPGGGRARRRGAVQEAALTGATPDSLQPAVLDTAQHESFSNVYWMTPTSDLSAGYWGNVQTAPRLYYWPTSARPDGVLDNADQGVDVLSAPGMTGACVYWVWPAAGDAAAGEGGSGMLQCMPYALCVPPGADQQVGSMWVPAVSGSCTCDAAEHEHDCVHSDACRAETVQQSSDVADAWAKYMAAWHAAQLAAWQVAWGVPEAEAEGRQDGEAPVTPPPAAPGSPVTPCSHSYSSCSSGAPVSPTDCRTACSSSSEEEHTGGAADGAHAEQSAGPLGDGVGWPLSSVRSCGSCGDDDDDRSSCRSRSVARSSSGVSSSAQDSDDCGHDSCCASATCDADSIASDCWRPDGTGVCTPGRSTPVTVHADAAAAAAAAAAEAATPAASTALAAPTAGGRPGMPPRAPAGPAERRREQQAAAIVAAALSAASAASGCRPAHTRPMLLQPAASAMEQAAREARLLDALVRAGAAEYARSLAAPGARDKRWLLSRLPAAALGELLSGSDGSTAAIAVALNAVFSDAVTAAVVYRVRPCQLSGAASAGLEAAARALGLSLPPCWTDRGSWREVEAAVQAGLAAAEPGRAAALMAGFKAARSAAQRPQAEAAWASKWAQLQAQQQALWRGCCACAGEAAGHAAPPCAANELQLQPPASDEQEAGERQQRLLGALIEAGGVTGDYAAALLADGAQERLELLSRLAKPDLAVALQSPQPAALLDALCALHLVDDTNGRVEEAQPLAQPQPQQGPLVLEECLPT